MRPAIYADTVTRSLLLSLGLDHVLVEFLVSTALGAFAILLPLIFVGAGIPRRRCNRKGTASR